MDLQPPRYIGPGASVFGEFAAGSGECSRITWVIVGAVAMYALPPLLSGMIEGSREAIREHRDGR